MKQTCRLSGRVYEVTSDDLAFLSKVSPVSAAGTLQIPPPTLSPLSRMQRRLSWRNERKLYRRCSDKSGKNIISIYSPDKAHQVYTLEEWFSDEWDAAGYGQTYDFNRPFFEQYKELLERVPLIPLLVGHGENADYTNYSLCNRNSYMIAAADYNENCFYANYLWRSRDSADCLFVSDCELCYECIDCTNCYETFWSSQLHNCDSCLFCHDCRSVRNCIACLGLRRQELCIFNKPCSKTAFQDKKQEILKDPESFQCEYEQFLETQNIRTSFLEASENCTGNNLTHCKNCTECYDLIEAEDCKYVSYGIKAKDCMDVFGAPDVELLYECTACPECTRSAFSASNWVGSHNLYYCYLCRACSDCFGCVSLHRKSYCILNKEYSRQDYETLLPQIVESMKESAEWGEFFPTELSPFAYNETAAMDYFPLTKAQVLGLGWKWAEEEVKPVQENQNSLLPKIEEATDSLCSQILLCEQSSKPYKIIEQEFQFYKKLSLPLPTRCPDIRHELRLKRRTKLLAA